MGRVMKREKYKRTMSKKIGAMTVCMLLLWVLSMSVHAAGKNGWVNGYYYINDVKQKSKWIKDGYNTYYVDSNGDKVTGWKKVDGSYYFFNQTGNNFETGKDIGAKITRLKNGVVTMGIDASTYQGEVDWKKVKKAGVNFVMLRVGYGKGRFGEKSCTLDKRFKKNVEGAVNAGIPIGIYFYSYATTEKQALKEAEFTIKQLDGVPVSFPVAFDVEDDAIVKKTTRAKRTAMVKIYMDTIAAAGYHPMYYCNQNWYHNYLDADELEGYDFWYARYTNKEPDPDEYPFSMWQATSTQRINGITENTVDIDFLYQDYSSVIHTRSSALKYGWYKEGGRLQYYYQGKHKTDGWFTYLGATYYLTSSGAATGWKDIGGDRYYFNKDGKLQTGFVKVGGKRYLLDEDGVLQLETDEPGVTIDETGVCHIKKGWYKDSKGRYFYRNSDGSIAKKKWITTNGKKYYVGSTGCRVTGFRTIGGKRYYFKKNGVMVKGWLTYKGHKYYFKSNGQMVSGKTVKINGKRYTFDKSGRLY